MTGTDNTALNAQRVIASLFKKPYKTITVTEMLRFRRQLEVIADSLCEHEFHRCQVPAGDSCQPIYHQVCRLCRWDSTKGVYMPPDIWEGWAARQFAHTSTAQHTTSAADPDGSLTSTSENTISYSEGEEQQ